MSRRRRRAPKPHPILRVEDVSPDEYRRQQRQLREDRCFHKLIAEEADELLVRVRAGELTAEQAWTQHRDDEQRRNHR